MDIEQLRTELIAVQEHLRVLNEKRSIKRNAAIQALEEELSKEFGRLILDAEAEEKRLKEALDAAKIAKGKQHPRIGEEWEYSVKGVVTRTAKIDVITPATYTPHYGSMSDGVNPGDLGLRVSADQIIPLRHIDGLGYSEWMPKGMKPTKENLELTRGDEYWAWG